MLTFHVVHASSANSTEQWSTWFKMSNGEGVCQSCPVTTYSSVESAVACVLCPADRTSLAGITLLSDCMCIAGSTADSAGACQACSAGTYSFTGDTVCSDCMQGTFAVRQASSTCSLCGAGTYADSEQCRMMSPSGFARFLGKEVLGTLPPTP